MLRAIRMTACAPALLLSCLLFSQQPSSPDAGSAAAVRPASAKTKPADAGKAPDKTPKLTENQKLALQLLETSEAASRGFEAPMRSFSLMNVAQSLTGTDQARARGLLRDAFTASLEIHDDDGAKFRMQREVFITLLPLSQEDVEELLPQAELSVRRPITELIVGRHAEKKQFDKAMELINQLAAVDEFPYGSASKMIEAMPPEMSAEKQTLFTQALASYKSHDHSSGVLVGPSTFSGMIQRAGSSMPPKLVLLAIEEVLSQAKAKTDQEVRLAGPGGSARFASEYQFQLFSLLPTLRKLDENRAKQLLENNQQLQAQLQQFPEGMSSLMPPPPSSTPAAGSTSSTTTVRTSTVTSTGTPAAGVVPVGTVQDFLRRDARQKVEAIAKEAETDPVQAIAHTMTLPLEIDDRTPKSSPRADALEAIARANVKKNPEGANSALSELRKVVTGLAPRAQADHLTTAANLYLQMEDKDKAEKTVSEGLKVADKLREQDVNPDSRNEALKAWWPSTDAYRRFVEIEAKISSRAALDLLKEIKDPEIRTVESIMFARSLLGLPVKRFMVVEKRGGSETQSVSESN
jgi:hypothetical protein